MLRDHNWKLKYTPDDGDVVRLFYVPALKEAKRYDRLSGFFTAGALALAARGIEGLVRNEGHMRLVVGCTLDPPEIEAIERGEKIRTLVEQHLGCIPLMPPDDMASDALELLAWMISRGYLELKAAVPCDTQKNPIPDDGIFHEKAGIIQDGDGDRIAWNGSLNETVRGWGPERNWESINIFSSWTKEPERVNNEDANFARIWADEANNLIVLPVPEAVRQDLMRFLPENGDPARLRGREGAPKKRRSPPEKDPDDEPTADLRSRVWSFIQQAPNLPDGGERVGETTSSISPWPHQVKAFERLYRNWPPKLLIADEVGLGKTIQAGMLLRQAWLAGRAKRILILAPKAILVQWQIELREKFNLDWPIYDGQKLVWLPSPARGEKNERVVNRDEWHKEPLVITSSHLMRRQDRASDLLEGAPPWDLVVLDEAHHARRRSAGAVRHGGPNALLQLMRGLKERTEGLLLLTATPMQVHPVEVWDLLSLFGLPPEWTEKRFLQFFEDINEVSPSFEAFDRMASLFRSIEGCYGGVDAESICRLTKLSRLKANKVLRALRDEAQTPRRQLETIERQAAFRIMKANTPIRRLVSRHTRELLRRYTQEGLLDAPIAERDVDDKMVELSPRERELYEAVESYISTTYDQASDEQKNAVGFIMTVYRRRLASSFRALRCTLQNRLDAMRQGRTATSLYPDEDALDEVSDEGELLDSDDIATLEQRGLIAEEKESIRSLLQDIGRLPPDSKLTQLKSVLAELRRAGYRQTMVFTQYTDTMDFLREQLGGEEDLRLMCFSGRGGEIPSAGGEWRRVGRDKAKRHFREGVADILLCTDAAAEGLNFQFCGALVNFDMPWNPMRVEQRIGRIDRLGQQFSNIRIVNLHYKDTVETDVYRALRDRIGLFETVVGPLQPILSKLSRTISDAVLAGRGRDDAKADDVTRTIERQLDEAKRQGFNIDEVTEDDLFVPERQTPPITMDDLDRVISSPTLMPPGTEVDAMGRREYRLLAPGMAKPLRVTTDPSYYEDHAESVELWSPGNLLFKAPEVLAAVAAHTHMKRLSDLLDIDVNRSPVSVKPPN